MARELGASYYETSVYTFFGVEELFENAVRAALCSRWIYSFTKIFSSKFFNLEGGQNASGRQTLKVFAVL